MPHDLNDWRTVMLGSAALGQTVFILLYLTFPWWRSFLGRVLFGKALMLAIVMDFFIIGRILGFAGNDAVYLCLYFFLSAGIWAQTFAFVHVKVSRNGDIDS